MTLESDFQTSHTATSTLYERARSQHVRISWSLLDEWGPAHERMFRIKLSLQRTDKDDSEEFEGLGSSIKIAKRIASTSALEQSVLLSKHNRKLASEDPKKQCFANLLNDVRSLCGPRAEIQQLASVLHLRTKFTQSSPIFSSRSSMKFNTNAADFCSSTPTCRRVILHIAGRQFVGEATSRSGAEQEASLAALKAFKRALDSIETSWKSKKPNVTTDDLLKYIQPNNSTWRLKLVGALHFEQPAFKVTEVTATHGLPQFKRTYQCICTLKSLGTTEALGQSRSIACKNASSLMLDRLLGQEARTADPVPATAVECQRDAEASEGKTVLSRAEMKLRHDRAQPTYAKDMHPVTRLEHVCFTRANEPPFYVLEDANQTGKNTTPEFVFRVRTGSEWVRGPPACNKRLARRLAAEAMLDHLGFSKSHSPVRPGALRCPQKDPAVIEDADTERTDDGRSDSDQSPKPIHRVQFSYAREMVMFHSTEGKVYSKRLRGRLGRPTFGLRSQKRSSRTKKGHDTANLALDASSTSSIGHWSDSEEAQMVPRSSILRRARSHSGLRGGINSCFPSCENSAPIAASQTESPPFCANLLVLGQIASLRLKESGLEDSTNITDQLLTLCQRLRLPCQFTDRFPEKQTNNSLSDERYHTTLTIGLTSDPQDTTPASGVIVAHGSGPSLNVARQQSTRCAFQQLAKLAE